MKWRQWSILISLVLLNYIIFSTAFNLLANQRRARPDPTRTPLPTFESIRRAPSSWVVLPTHTSRPTRPPHTPTVTPSPTSATAEITQTVSITDTTVVVSTESEVLPTLTSTPLPPTATPEAEVVIHVVKQGETLSEIAAQYEVSIQAIMEANGLTDPNRIVTGQELIIPEPEPSTPTTNPPTS